MQCDSRCVPYTSAHMCANRSHVFNLYTLAAHVCPTIRRDKTRGTEHMGSHVCPVEMNLILQKSNIGGCTRACTCVPLHSVV